MKNIELFRKWWFWAIVVFVAVIMGIDNFFGMLGIAFLVISIIGLIRPTVFEKYVKNPTRKWIFGYGLLVCIVCFILLGATYSNPDKPTLSNTNESTAENSEAPKADNTPTKNAEPVDKTEFAAGETIQLKNHTLKVNSVNKNYSSGNQFIKPSDSNNSYVLLDVTFVNTSQNDDLPINSYGFKLEDETGTKRDTTFGVVDGSLQSVTLAKGGTTSGKILFEAKRNSSVLKLYYTPGIFGGSEITVNL